MLNSEWDMKFYFLHIKVDDIGNTLKCLGTNNSNVENLSKG